MTRQWHDAIDPTAKKLELAAMFKGAVQLDTVSCIWLGNVLRSMALIADRDAADRAASLLTVRFLGLKFTIARDG